MKDHQPDTKTSAWPNVLAFLLGAAFVGSVVGVYFVGYYSAANSVPELPPAGDVGHLEPGDRIVDTNESDSAPDYIFLRTKTILGDPRETLENGGSSVDQDSADKKPASSSVQNVSDSP